MKEKEDDIEDEERIKTTEEVVKAVSILENFSPLSTSNAGTHGGLLDMILIENKLQLQLFLSE